MSDKQRKTGRTTRMLEEARRLAAAGRAVYVVVATPEHRNLLRREFGCDVSVAFETPNTIGLDWKTLSVRGMHPNCVILVDHYAIEYHFNVMLDALHRFDAPAKEVALEERMRKLEDCLQKAARIAKHHAPGMYPELEAEAAKLLVGVRSSQEVLK